MTDSIPPANADLQRRSSLRRLAALWAAVSVPLGACGSGSGDSTPVPPNPSPPSPTPPSPTPPSPPPPSPTPPSPPPPPPPSSAPRTTVLNSTLDNPWGLAFLPDGKMLVTQKPGSILVLSANGATKLGTLAGVPTVLNAGQGGLLDIALDPDFTSAGSNWVYFTYSESSGGLSGTAVQRGRLDLANFQLLDVAPAPIFRQLPKSNTTGHYGSRLAFRADKTLFITLGERQEGSPAQDLSTHLGKVVRINRDGSIPAGNMTTPAGVKPEIWSYGHRNPQGAAIHPTTGELWELEHGPQGGDELNIARMGGNYGWPNKSYGCDYNVTTPNCQIGGGGGVHAPTYVEPVSRFPAPSAPVPSRSIAPSGLAFYTGAGFPEWQGNVFLGALVDQALWRIALNGNAEASRERLLGNLNERIRCVKQGPDGWIYLLTDSGKLIKVDR